MVTSRFRCVDGVARAGIRPETTLHHQQRLVVCSSEGCVVLIQAWSFAAEPRANLALKVAEGRSEELRIRLEGKQICFPQLVDA